MRFESRLRQGLISAGEAVAVDVENELGTLLAKAHARHRQRVAAAALAAAAIAVAFALMGPRLSDMVFGLEDPIRPVDRERLREADDRDRIWVPAPDADRARVERRAAGVIQDVTRRDSSEPDAIREHLDTALAPESGKPSDDPPAAAGSSSRSEGAGAPMPVGRRVSQRYGFAKLAGAHLLASAVINCSGADDNCVEFHGRRGETLIQIDIEDRAGEAVWASVSEHRNSGTYRELGEFCGSTPEPLPISPRAHVVVVIEREGCTRETDPAPAGGRVIGTFFDGVE